MSLRRGLYLFDPDAVQAVGGSRGVDRVDRVRGVTLVVRCVQGYEHTVRADSSQPYCAHQKTRQHAPLDVHAVSGKLVYVGGVYDVGMGYQRVGDLRERDCRWRRVSGVTAHLRADPGRNHHHDVEAVLSLESALPELE